MLYSSIKRSIFFTCLFPLSECTHYLGVHHRTKITYDYDKSVLSVFRDIKLLVDVSNICTYKAKRVPSLFQYIYCIVIGA